MPHGFFGESARIFGNKKPPHSTKAYSISHWKLKTEVITS